MHLYIYAFEKHDGVFAIGRDGHLFEKTVVVRDREVQRLELARKTLKQLQLLAVVALYICRYNRICKLNT